MPLARGGSQPLTPSGGRHHHTPPAARRALRAARARSHAVGPPASRSSRFAFSRPACATLRASLRRSPRAHDAARRAFLAAFCIRVEAGLPLLLF